MTAPPVTLWDIPPRRIVSVPLVAPFPLCTTIEPALVVLVPDMIEINPDLPPTVEPDFIIISPLPAFPVESEKLVITKDPLAWLVLVADPNEINPPSDIVDVPL